MADDDGLPRLPSVSQPMQLPFEPQKVAAAEVVLNSEWSEFPEPKLLGTSWSRRGVTSARLLVFIWAVVLVATAMVTRSNLAIGVDEGTTVRLIGRIGLVVAGVTVVVSWWWSDRQTRNVHLLEARLPTRWRCLRAWVAPCFWFVLLAVTVVKLQPTELLDLRPPILIPIFAAALWRPYSLVRRILTSLVRVGSDALIGIAYMLDLASIGLLWWQLTTWPTPMTQATSGRADVFIGVSAAAAAAMCANVAIWAALVRGVARAEAHRLIAIRTRHDHRQLRLRGIDPMDPQVRWALLRIRQTQLESSGDLGGVSRTAPSVVAPPERTVVAPTATNAVPRITSDAADVEVGGGLVRKLPRLQGAGQVGAPTESATGADAEPATELESSPLASASPSPTVDDESLRVPIVPGAQPSRDQPPTTRVARLRDAFRHEPDSDEQRHWTTDRFGLLASPKVDDANLPVSGESLLRRLEEYGITRGPATAEPVAGSSHPDGVSGAVAGWTPPKLYGLDLARLLLILAIVAVVTTSIWITYRSVAVGSELVDGMIGPDEVDQLDLARRALVVTLGIATAAVPFWASVLTIYARRAGVPRLTPWRGYVLFAAAIVLNVLAFVLDGSIRGTVSLLFLVGSLATALVATSLLVSAQRGLGLRMTTPMTWTGGLVLLVLVSWVGGLQRPIEPTAALEALTFASAFETILAGAIAVIVTLSTSDLVDEMKLATARFNAIDQSEASESPAVETADG